MTGNFLAIYGECPIMLAKFRYFFQLTAFCQILTFVYDHACMDCCQRWPWMCDKLVTLLKQNVWWGGALIIQSRPLCDPETSQLSNCMIFPLVQFLVSVWPTETAPRQSREWIIALLASRTHQTPDNN